jgi:hypothetical protein
MLDCVSSQALQDYGLAGQRIKRFLCVYVLVSESNATKHYTGKSTTVAAAHILQSSNPGGLRRQPLLHLKRRRVRLRNIRKAVRAANSFGVTFERSSRLAGRVTRQGKKRNSMSGFL